MLNDKVKLGKTGIEVNRNGFGALPIQRISIEAAVEILRKAYESGIEYFDSGRGYTDSEEKLGIALSDVRENIILATKTKADNSEEFWKDLRTSLKMLKTDYIDVYQFHNPDFCPKPGDGSGLYEAMIEAKSQGLIKHIGISNHKLPIAFEAVESGLYETLQFPFSYIAIEREIELVKLCKEKGVGFIAMKGMAGGLLSSPKAAYAFISEQENVLPIWGVQKISELDDFLSFFEQKVVLDAELQEHIKKDRAELSGDFCRGCGYCLPCPAGIDIPNAARMSLMIRRAPTTVFFNESWQAKMKKIDDCILCHHCSDNCPYSLDTPNLLKKNWEDYKEFI
jgi:predicted aldo/keto reductase-like oxidoreductase